MYRANEEGFKKNESYNFQYEHIPDVDDECPRALLVNTPEARVVEAYTLLEDFSVMPNPGGWEDQDETEWRLIMAARDYFRIFRRKIEIERRVSSENA